MAGIGIAPHVIEKALNHSTGQISGAQPSIIDTLFLEKTDVLNVWDNALGSIVDTASSNVINIGKTGE
jgi:hypothetical protein